MQLDRVSTVSRSVQKATLILNELKEFCDLVDAWRSLHSTLKEYSYYSSVHGMSSRIDHLINFREFMGNIMDCTYLARTFSDHSPILASIRLPRFQGNMRWWCFKPAAHTDVAVAGSLLDEMQMFFTHNDGSVPPLIFLRYWIGSMLLAALQALE